MIHRAISGSIERFLAVLIEHYEGAFPMWLAPVQIRIATVSESFTDHAQKLAVSLREADLRVELDTSNETVGKKIRNAAMMKIPWTIVIGEKEATGSDITVKIFASKEDLVITQNELVTRANEASQMPV